MLLINTFDVEPWWCTVPPCVPNSQWDGVPDRSEEPLRAWLDLCDEAGVKCTFFCLGWYGRRFPQRLREIVRRGHEVGCHSLQHEDVATLSDNEFARTTREAKTMIEDAAGAEVIAYRAPSFSFPPERCRSLLQALHGLGFRIDSSITTADRLYGGGYSRAEFPRPLSLKERYGVDIVEVPVPGVRIAGREVQVFGGGYLRLVPCFALKRLATRETYQVLYLHPHDFDTAVPALPSAGTLPNLRRRLRVGDLRAKVLALFAASQVQSCGQAAQGIDA